MVDSPPVAKLKTLLHSDDKFRQLLQSALANVKPLEGGQANPWQGKSERDLYRFLNEWFYFLPTKENGLDKIMQFSLLYYRNSQGLVLLGRFEDRYMDVDY